MLNGFCRTYSFARQRILSLASALISDCKFAKALDGDRFVTMDVYQTEWPGWQTREKNRVYGYLLMLFDDYEVGSFVA
jgi:hypothetical protein